MLNEKEILEQANKEYAKLCETEIEPYDPMKINSRQVKAVITVLVRAMNKELGGENAADRKD